MIEVLNFEGWLITNYGIGSPDLTDDDYDMYYEWYEDYKKHSYTKFWNEYIKEDNLDVWNMSKETFEYHRKRASEIYKKEVQYVEELHES